MTGHPWLEALTRQPRQDSFETSKSAQLWKENYERIAMTGQPWQDSHDRTAMTGQPN